MHCALKLLLFRHAGNGAIFYYSGDRVTLESAEHEVVGSTISYSNRYLYCYVPMVALADCGNAIRDCELFGGPHQGTFISGNDHVIEDSLLHDLVEACSDSGTIYMVRVLSTFVFDADGGFLNAISKRDALRYSLCRAVTGLTKATLSTTILFSG